jgi:hypothetical protein
MYPIKLKFTIKITIGYIILMGDLSDAKNIDIKNDNPEAK